MIHMCSIHVDSVLAVKRHTVRLRRWRDVLPVRLAKVCRQLTACFMRCGSSPVKDFNGKHLSSFMHTTISTVSTTSSTNYQ